jgi:hypothetical protein
MGRKPKLTAHQTREAIKRREEGEEPPREIARTYNGLRPAMCRSFCVSSQASLSVTPSRSSNCRADPTNI